MPVDTSFYNQQPVSAIPGGIPGAVSLANALTENRLLNQNLLSREAVGNAFQGSLNNDGTVDFSKLSEGLQDPAAAYGAPAAIQDMANLRTNSIANAGANLNQTSQRLNNFYNSLGGYLSQPGGPKYSDVMGRAFELRHAGLLTDDDIGSLQNAVPTNSKALSGWAKTRYESTLGPDQTNPMVTGVNGAGTPLTGTTNQLINKMADAASSGAGGVPLTVSPGVNETLAASGRQYQALGESLATYGQQNSQMMTALHALQSTSTGPGTEARQNLSSYMLALPGGIGQWLAGASPESIKQYDIARKNLTAAAIGTPSANRSDSAQDNYLQSNPSVHISNAAAQELQKANIAYRRSEMTAHQIFSQIPGADPSDFTRWYADYNSLIDPKAFAADLQSPSARAAYFNSLSDKSVGGQPSPRQRFRDTVKMGIAAHQIDPGAFSANANSGAASQ